MGGERSRPIWWQTFPFMLLVTIGSAALCPRKCSCNDETLFASCKSAGLEVVPIQLNPEVQYIDLSDNRITHVLFTLSFYNSLVTLNLSMNKIKTLGSSNFELQNKLNLLNLSHNEISNISKDSFKGLRAVTELDLSHNWLEELKSESFRELHSLQSLKLSENRLVYLEGGLFKSAKHLKKLILDNNLFLTIPTAALVDTINLTYLSLSNNLVKSILDDEMPGLTNLKILLLNSNIIDEIDQSALSGLITLDHLDLSDNNLTMIPTGSLMKLSNITKLKFSGNFIEIVPPVAFKGLFHLRQLNLDRQELLHSIDRRAFVDNINLEKVCLDDNIAVEGIPTKLFYGNLKLTHLSIRNNKLSNLEVNHFPLDQLKVLKLAGNPLECNCSLSWLWYLVQEQKLKQIQNSSLQNDLILDLENIKCAGPEELSHVLLMNARESSITCSISWIAALSVTFSSIFIFIVAASLLYWGSIKKMRSNNKTEVTNKSEDSFDPNERTNKCIMIEHHDFPSWHPYYNEDKSQTSNIYHNFDLNKRPHIVYV